MPVLLQPYPDELLYSWILRLAKANQLSVVSFVKFYMNLQIRSERELPYDIRAGFLPLCENLNADVVETFLALSTFPMEAMFMTIGQQIRYINNIFRPKDALNVPANKLIKKIRICPECMKADIKMYGEAYLHREHQVSYIYTCYQHQCLLQEYQTKQQIVPNKTVPLKKYNAEDFKKEVMNEVLLEQYICKNCGKTYYTTPKAIESGWGCPYCETTIEDTFQNLINVMGNGEYSTEDPFESLNKKLMMYHKPCGQKQEIKPRRFLFEEQRCACEHRVTEAVARKRIEQHKGYRLITFHNTTVPVTIFREECGHEFTCSYQKFLNFPGCRVCKPNNMTAEIYEMRVRNLVGEDYTIVNGFKDQHTKVRIRHNACGNVQPYKPSAFLDGQRCKECCKQISRWKEMFQLLLEYKHMFGNTNIAKQVIFEERPLGQWCNRQRLLYKKGCLKKNREQQLLEVGFIFDPLEAEWFRRYKQYKRYIAETGSCVISRRTDFEGEHLGAWVMTQHKNYEKGKLSEKRTLLMRELDSYAFA